ncbi:MAG: hypothetical protein LBH15_08840 [Treponema sp.]|jgi:hypothetical protein|nr:hypothetical protein [Treponema sp.]
MKNLCKGPLALFLGISAIGALIGLGLTGCPTDGGDGNAGPKTLVITGISDSLASQGQSNFRVGIFQPGTTPAEAMAQTGYVAGAESENAAVTGSGSSYTATVSLYAPSSDRWTGSGTYDVYLVIGSGNYRAQGISFNDASTSVPATRFSPLN